MPNGKCWKPLTSSWMTAKSLDMGPSPIRIWRAWSGAADVNSHRFGFAVQLGLLRYPGWPATRRDKLPLPLLQYVAEQLQIPTEHLEEYARREPTRTEHLQEIMDLYGFRYYSTQIAEELAVWSKTQVHLWTTPTGLWMALLEKMRGEHSIPGGAAR